VIRFFSENDVKIILDLLAFYKNAHKHDRAYQFRQEGVHPEWIQNEEMMQQKIEYIHQNPVERGYVDRPEQWRYSSEPNYVGFEGLIGVSKVVSRIRSHAGAWERIRA
jgi:putative transposase